MKRLRQSLSIALVGWEKTVLPGYSQSTGLLHGDPWTYLIEKRNDCGRAYLLHWLSAWVKAVLLQGIRRGTDLLHDDPWTDSIEKRRDSGRAYLSHWLSG